MTNLHKFRAATEEMARLIESASWGDVSWQQVLAGFAENITGTRIHSIHHHPFDNHALSLSCHDIEDTIAENYQRYYISLDPWAPVLAAQPNGAVFVSERQMPAYLFKKSEYYVDHLSLMKSHKAWCGIKINVSHDENLFIGLHYQLQNSKDLDCHYSNLLKALRSPLSRLIRTSELNNRSNQLITAGGAITAVDKPALVVNNAMRLIEINPSGEVFLSQNKLASIHNGRVIFCHCELEAIIQSRVKNLSESPLALGESIGWIYKGQRWIIEFKRIGRDFGKPPLHSPALILIVMNNIDIRSATPDISVLRSLFMLTDTECRLCCSLFHGNGLTQAAKNTGISYEHARQRIKVIFSKTHTASQVQLNALLTQLSH